MNRSSSALWVAAAILILAFTFQGTRGLWEPDEGYYANGALGMLRTGDWWVPRLNGEPFLDKPPLHYWGIAAGMAALGVNEWGARLPHALFFVATALLVGALGGRMWGASAGHAATLAYAMSLAPFLAANVLTPDTPLAACTALVYLAYWQAELHRGRPGLRALWWLAVGLGVGLGLLAKGAAILVFLPPLGAHLLWQGRLKGVLREGSVFLGVAVALACGAFWYISIGRQLPGAWDYIVDNQVTGRLLTARYERNSRWVGPFKVYLPTLLAGALPWSLFWAAGIRRFFRRLRTEGLARVLPREPESRLIVLWIVLPLAVLVAARSRLPFYLLPLFGPLALAAARRLAGVRHPAWVAAWCLLLLALKGVAAYWPAYQDTRRVARELKRDALERTEVVAVDVNRNALPFYGIEPFEWVTTDPEPYPFFTLQESLATEASELKSSPRRHLFLLSPAKAAEATVLLAKEGATCRPTVAGPHPALLCEAAGPRGPN